MKKIFLFAALLALSACVTTGPDPVVTQAERDNVHAQLNFREQCLAVVKNQPLQSVDPAKDCDCVHRGVADTMPAWYIRRMVDYDSGKNRTTLSVGEVRRVETELSAITIAAYRSCGVIP